MINIDMAKCSGCRRCEVNCSFFRTGSVGRAKARVKVVKIEEIGLDYPVSCRQCRERYCLKCPESAIEIGSFGQVIVSPTLCISCGTCEKLCPIGAIELVGDIPFVCDLCGGDPRCVKQCTLGAIVFEPEIFEAVTLEEFKKNARGLDPEEKRVRYALASFKKLRDRWLEERRP